MSAITTAYDGLRVYLTGASVSGGVQRDARLSLGGYRSSQRAGIMTWHRYDAMPGLVVDYVSGTNCVGLGFIEAQNDDYVRYTPPRGTAGDWVDLSATETPYTDGVVVAGTAALHSGDTGTFDGYVIVRRVRDADGNVIPLHGVETLQIMDTVNNVFGMEEGYGAYRAVMLRNESDHLITQVRIIHLLGGYSDDIRVAVQSPYEGALETILPGQSPSLTFTKPTSYMTIAASLEPGEEKGLWLYRPSIKSGLVAATPYSHVGCKIIWTSEEESYREHIRGACRISDATLPKYLVFVGQDAAPDLQGTPDYELDEADLPYTLTSALSADHDYDIRIVSQNKHGVRDDDEGQIIVLRLNASGDVEEDPPSAPYLVSVENDADGKIHIEAFYDPRREGDTPAEQLDLRATRWALYIGTADDMPDPDADEPVAVAMHHTSQVSPERLSYTSPSAYLEYSTVYVAICAQRNDGTTEVPDWNQSEATWDHVEVRVNGAGRPHGVASFGLWEAGVYQRPPVIDRTVYIDEAKNVYWEVLVGETRLWADTALVWNLRYGGVTAWNGLFTTFAFQEGDVSAVQSSAVEIGTWDAGAKEIHFAVNGTRRMTVDVVAETVTCAGLTEMGEILNSFSDDPAWEIYGALNLQVYMAKEEQYNSAAALGTDGVLALGAPWIQRLTQGDCL